MALLLLWRQITSLDIAGNGIRVAGAQALLDSMRILPLPAPPVSLLALGELVLNRRAGRRQFSLPAPEAKGGQAGQQPARRKAMSTERALPPPPPGSTLRVLNLEDNALPPALLDEVAARL